MIGKELRDFCKGKIVAVVFNSGIENCECRFENNMKAYIIGVGEPDRDDVVPIVVEERDFAEYNKSIESSIWLNNETGVFDLKYSDSYWGKDWNGKETIYVMEDDVDGYFSILDDNKINLFKEYQGENSDLTYVEWLENKILKSTFLKGVLNSETC